MDDVFTSILATFQKNGGRITAQRKKLLSVVLSHPDSSVKEIYYMARKDDASIGRATVYRFLHQLEALGLLRRQSVIVTKSAHSDRSKNLS